MMTVTNKYKSDTLEYKILRGADKIGANLLEFSYKDTKILVEFGCELDNEEGLTAQEQELIEAGYDAAIISHYHGDHAANIAELKCPVYMGQKCKAVMEIQTEYTRVKMPKEVKTFRSHKPFRIGAIKITPYLCDHSAFDSYMLLIEGGGKKILYTGDYRSSGRKDFEKLLNKLPSEVDVLITEGTNWGRITPNLSEKELEQQAVEIIQKSDKPIFVLQSSTNIDRLVSFFRAAKNLKFYIDDYQAQICNAVEGNIPRPDIFPNVYAFMSRGFRGNRYEKYNKMKNKISRKAIGKQNKYVIIVHCSHLDYIKKLSHNEKADLNGAILIYSLWDGYMARDDMKAFLNEITDLGIKIVTLHASGHADEDTVKRLIMQVNPKKVECIHTEKNSSEK